MPQSDANSRDQSVASLEELTLRVSEVAAENDRPSVETVIAAVGERSFGAILLLSGLVILVPLVGDIPGVPTLMAIVVLLTSLQLLLGREYFWLPDWLLRRSTGGDGLHRAMRKARGPARVVDRLIRPRLSLFVEGPSRFGIALACLFIALLVPLMEFVPFSANIAGAGLTMFGLAFIGRDGLMAIAAFVLTLAGVATLAIAFT